MIKVPQTREELSRHLEEQLGFLKRSADAYDQGYESEARRLAVTIRILVHDTGKSKSLLTQLDEKHQLFYDTALPEEPDNHISYGGLVQLAVGPSGSVYLPFLDDRPPLGEPSHVPFDGWWSRLVFRTEEGETLTRADLVLSIADQDGGAHVDQTLNEAYAELSRGSGMGCPYEDREGSRAIRAPELAAMRQIAHEVIKTLDHSYSNHIKIPEGAFLVASPAVQLATPDDVAALDDQRPQRAASNRTFRRSSRKISRNAHCLCGSGKKYKHCCGSRS